MKIKLYLSILIVTILNATEYKYEVISPLMGKLGLITIDSVVTDDTYDIKAKAVTDGIAALLTKDRREYYLSKGHRVDSSYITDIFKITRESKSKKEIDEYIFEHKDLVVFKKRLRWKNNHLKKDDKKRLKYHTNIDLVATYLNNIQKFLNRYNLKESFKVAGAEKIGGEIIVYTPSIKTANRQLKRMHLNSGSIVIVTTTKEIFGKRGRELVMAIDSGGVVKRAYIEAIPVVGSIYLNRIR